MESFISDYPPISPETAQFIELRASLTTNPDGSQRELSDEEATILAGDLTPQIRIELDVIAQRNTTLDPDVLAVNSDGSDGTLGSVETGVVHR
jgi:hypothetical protein